MLTNENYYDLKNNLDEELSTNYYMSEIAELDFEEVIDWSKVAVDTKILVRQRNDEEWTERHFAKYEDGKIYAWKDGRTSFTIRKYSAENHYTYWNQTKLYKEGEE